MSNGMPTILPSYIEMPSTSGLEKSSQSKPGIASSLLDWYFSNGSTVSWREGRHPGLVEIVEVVGAELALHVERGLLQHLLERDDLDLDLDAGERGELLLGDLVGHDRGRRRLRGEADRGALERARRRPSATPSRRPASAAAASSLPTLVRPPNGRPWPRKVEAKPEKPMPASAMRRRNSRLPMRRSVNALAVSAMKVFRSKSRRLMGLVLLCCDAWSTDHAVSP